MKLELAILFIGLTAASAVVYALDLPALARRERARRSGVASKPGRAFDDRDLERYRTEEAADVPAPDPAPRPAPPRELPRERARFRKELEQHQREVAKLDANLRRLEWRLNEKRARRPTREWLAEDPAIAMIEDSIRALREERDRIERRFRERARKEGALPGWLR